MHLAAILVKKFPFEETVELNNLERLHNNMQVSIIVDNNMKLLIMKMFLVNVDVYLMEVSILKLYMCKENTHTIDFQQSIV